MTNKMAYGILWNGNSTMTGQSWVVSRMLGWNHRKILSTAVKFIGTEKAAWTALENVMRKNLNVNWSIRTNRFEFLVMG